MINSPEDIFFTLFFVFFFLTALSWITFAQFSMRRIEQKIQADGLPNDFSWDGVGARVFSYAFAIVFPENLALRLNRLMDVSTIRSYAVKADAIRGAIFLSVTYIWITIIFIGAAMGFSD